MIIRQHDTVPLDTEEIREKEPIERALRDHPAWPDRTLHLYMDYNESVEKWVWRIAIEPNTQESIQTVIPRQPVHYGEPYRYGQYFLFIFMDLSREESRVTPRNLGDTVDLVGYPGPASPGWVDWVRRQSFDSEEDREAWIALSDSY